MLDIVVIFLIKLLKPAIIYGLMVAIILEVLK